MGPVSKCRIVRYNLPGFRHRAAIVVDTHHEGVVDLVVFRTGPDDRRLDAEPEYGPLMVFRARVPNGPPSQVGSWSWPPREQPRSAVDARPGPNGEDAGSTPAAGTTVTASPERAS